MESDIELQSLIGEVVVLDAVSSFVYVGRLVATGRRYFILEDADVHDLRDSNSTRELYVLELTRHGRQANRQNVLVDSTQIVSISALRDVVH